MDEAAARAMVAEFLATLPTRGKDRWVTSRVEDHGDFWLVCWTTARALAPRNLNAPTAGNYPIGVRKSDGLARFWTLLFPLAEFAQRLRARPETLPQFPDPWVAGEADHS
jgi:hypothetical protein